MPDISFPILADNHEQPPILRLPTEILDLIIQCLSGDNKAISACTLVCRSFYETSVQHHFYGINFTFTNQESVMDPAVEYAAFDRLLLSNPQLATHIKYTCITIKTHKRKEELVDFHRVLEDAVFNTLNRLDNLQDLWLDMSDMLNGEEFGLGVAKDLRFPSVLSLQLMETPSLPLCLLHCFPNLTELELFYAKFDTKDQQCQHSIADEVTRASLTKLTIKVGKRDEVYEVFATLLDVLKLPEITRVQELDLEIRDDERQSIYAKQIIELCCVSVQTLHLRLLPSRRHRSGEFNSTQFHYVAN
ncbi:hypothetical protein BDQ12DRAFT_723881 [Crucibulum laeve]|uniref:F-box domain-containing protein n=1 Tax=Crucibulum laeve TaxID=68775 RepID=A0A5C3LZ19_9AGAR|nr:hypothetical protein BDQ12DRAFT_723881 [Crucibulum laeve]